MQQIMYPFIAKRFSLPPDLAILQNNTRDALETIEQNLHDFIVSNVTSSVSAAENNGTTIVQIQWNNILQQYNQLEKYFVSIRYIKRGITSINKYAIG